MLDYSLAHWIAFLTAAVLLNLSPGPDMAFILGHTLKSGTRTGFAALFGIWTGASLHVATAAFGLSAILAASALAFSIVKWIGAIYLIWLGIQALRSKGDGGLVNAAKDVLPRGRVYRQGILVSLLNPKVAIFFLAFLPQFVVDGAGPTRLQRRSMACSSSPLPPSSSRRSFWRVAALPISSSAREASASGSIAVLARCWWRSACDWP